jgi:hypothetical protein
MVASADNIELAFKRDVSDELEIVREGPDRYVVITPLAFGDGDVLPIVLRRQDNDGWLLTDEGHTFMQLTYELDDADFQQPTRREIILRTLSAFGLQNRKGELVLPISDEKYGDALYSFIQALLKIDDIRYLSRERVRSSFMEDFKELMARVTSRERVSYNWHEPQRDPDAKYPVDCRINGTPSPLFIFALPSDERAAIATITLHMFNRWNLSYKAVGIFEEQEKISPKTVARFTDICNKSFSNLSAASHDLRSFFPELVS